MDDQHQKTRDADKSQDASATRIRERQSAADSPVSAMNANADNANNESGQDRGNAEAMAGDAINQVSTLVRNVSEQARAVASNAGGTAQEMVRQAREQVSGVSGAVMESGARANDYITRNVNEYPLAALLIAGAVGYGVAYLLHNSWQSEGGRSSTRSNGNDSKR